MTDNDAIKLASFILSISHNDEHLSLIRGILTHVVMSAHPRFDVMGHSECIQDPDFLEFLDKVWNEK